MSIHQKSLAIALLCSAAMAEAAPQICWKNADQNEDGTPLEDLQSVRIFWGSASNEYDGSFNVPTNLPGETVCAQLDLQPGEWHIAAKSIARRNKALAGFPINLIGTAPETKTLSLDTSSTISDVILTLVVNDADIAGEGRASMGSWSVPLFDGQLGPDGQDHSVSYTIPKDEAAGGVLTLEHLTTAGYSVVSGTVEYEVESSFSNEITKTVEVAPIPPILALAPECAGCEQKDTTLLISKTGENVRLRWEPVTADSIEIEVLKYPGGTTPVARGTFSNSTFWDWLPARAGLYYSRIRACTAGVCGAWANSSEQGFLYYLQLASPTPGGLN